MKELDDIVEAIEAGFTYAEIAVLLNRSYYGIARCVAYYELREGWPTREEWLIRFD